MRHDGNFVFNQHSLDNQLVLRLFESLQHGPNVILLPVPVHLKRIVASASVERVNGKKKLVPFGRVCDSSAASHLICVLHGVMHKFLPVEMLVDHLNPFGPTAAKMDEILAKSAVDETTGSVLLLALWKLLIVFALAFQRTEEYLSVLEKIA